MKTKEQLWQRHIQRQESSGRSVALYCQKYDISVATFYYWSKKLRSLSEAGGTHFTEVQVISPAAVSPVVTVYLDDRVVVRIEGPASAAFIRELAGC